MEVAHRLQAENLQIYREGHLTCLDNEKLHHGIFNSATFWVMGAMKLFVGFADSSQRKTRKKKKQQKR